MSKGERDWSISSRMAFNTEKNNRYILRLTRSFEQSTGDPTGGTRKSWELRGRAIWGNGRHTLTGYYMKDKWGPYDFFRQFNVTFPEQLQLDYSLWLGGGFGSVNNAIAEQEATRVGIRTTYRTSDENSPDDEFMNGQNDYTFLTVIYFTYSF